MSNYDELVKRLRMQAEWVSSGIAIRAKIEEVKP